MNNFSNETFPVSTYIGNKVIQLGGDCYNLDLIYNSGDDSVGEPAYFEEGDNVYEWERMKPIIDEYVQSKINQNNGGMVYCGEDKINHSRYYYFYIFKSSKWVTGLVRGNAPNNQYINVVNTIHSFDMHKSEYVKGYVSQNMDWLCDFILEDKKRDDSVRGKVKEVYQKYVNSDDISHIKVCYLEFRPSTIYYSDNWTYLYNAYYTAWSKGKIKNKSADDYMEKWGLYDKYAFGYDYEKSPREERPIPVWDCDEEGQWYIESVEYPDGTTEPVKRDYYK